jgi:hypothetical protein
MEPVLGQKRGASKAGISAATPMNKKPRLSTDARPSPSAGSPATATPATTKPSFRVQPKVVDGRPLATLPEPQPTTLSDADYQSIAASAVLQASFTRSQTKWTCEGIFERYWVKPETGKNARPPPPNNPEAKWMKHKGECRLRIEPHIFACQMYVEEKPKPPAPPKQYAPVLAQGQAPYGQHQAYRPQQPYQQGRTLPPIQQGFSQQPGRPVQPVANAARTPTPSKPQPPPQQGKNPDPVISKLAARASTDPELKGLMKEVATGNANHDQLKIFQRHIDELQKQIKEENELEEKRAREAEAAGKAREESIQYDGVGSTGAATSTPASVQQHYSIPQQHPVQFSQPYAPPQQPQRPAPPVYQQPTPQQTPVPQPQPPPTKHPVVLGFSTPGATEDRFLFPQNAILEQLSEHHLLASFIVVKKGRHAADPTGLDPDKEYWQPVTAMLEVQWKREGLLTHIQNWVKPADEVKEWMQGVMKRCERAPKHHLAMRLPMRGSLVGSEAEDSGVSKEGTPIILTPAAIEEKMKSRPNVKYVKKAPTSKSTPVAIPASSAKKPQHHGDGKKSSGGAVKQPGTPSNTAMPPASTATAATADKEKQNKAADPSAVGTPTHGAADVKPEEQKTENGRPRRAVRKSVRISDG